MTADKSTTDTSPADRATKEYLRSLTFRLRMLDVPGPRIGEILAEVEAHVAATGETPQQAFGPPAEYARQWIPDAPARRRTQRWIAQSGWAVGGALAGFVLASGALAVGRGEPVLGASPWWTIGVGMVLVVAGAVALPVDVIVDPRDPESRRPSRHAMVAVVVVSAVVVSLVLAGLGLLLG